MIAPDFMYIWDVTTLFLPTVYLTRTKTSIRYAREKEREKRERKREKEREKERERDRRREREGNKREI